jgi:hypothetical protein
MIYNTIHHDIRNKVGLSLIDYCLLESIYKLSNSSKSTYQSWCNASKSSFSYLASKRTIGTRFEYLEANGWIEFYDKKRYLKRTTKKYYNEVFLYVEGVKKLPREETSPVKELHPSGEEVAPLVVKKLHPSGEEVAPNNTIDNKKDNNIDRESKKALTQEKENLLLKIQKLEAENLELKNQSEAQKGKEKSSAKKEKGSHVFPSNEPKKKYKPNANGFPSMEEFGEMPKHEQQITTKYEAFLKDYTYPSWWNEKLKESFLEWCAYKNEILLGSFGATNTKAVIREIKDYLKTYNIDTICKSIQLSLKEGWKSFDPQRVINREEKKKQDEQKRREQTDSNGKPLRSKYDRFNEDFFGSEHTSDAIKEDPNVQEF